MLLTYAIITVMNIRVEQANNGVILTVTYDESETKAVYEFELDAYDKPSTSDKSAVRRFVSDILHHATDYQQDKYGEQNICLTFSNKGYKECDDDTYDNLLPPPTF